MSDRHRTFRDAVEAHDVDVPPYPWCEQAAADWYDESSEFLGDALDWIGDSVPADLPPRLVRHIASAYRASPTYATAVEDIRCGDRRVRP